MWILYANSIKFSLEYFFNSQQYYLGFTQNTEIAIDSTILKSLLSFLCKAFAENIWKGLHHLAAHLSYVSNCAAALGEREQTTIF